MTIYDLITSSEIVAYWELVNQDREPFIGEQLFPSDKKLGLDLKWLKGSNGIPVVLKPSAFDVAAIPRPRIGFDELNAEMPFFKESKYIDEELRQELNKIIGSGVQAYIDAVVNRIFNDELSLLDGARAQRERMRMMMLTTGTISITANGQDYDYDYQMPLAHKVNAAASWAGTSANIINDIRTGIDKIIEDTGVTPARAICGTKVMGYIRNNTEIKKSVLARTDGNGYISDAMIKQFMKDEFGIAIETNDKRYVDEAGVTQRYVADDIFCMFPEGALGTTWFGTTPEESDLMASGVANVTITDTGVAVTTTGKTDPVQVDTKVTMICLPDFPTADQVYVIDVLGA